MINKSSCCDNGFGSFYTKSTLPQELFPYTHHQINLEEVRCQEMNTSLASRGELPPIFVAPTSFLTSVFFATLIFGFSILAGAPAVPMILLGSVVVITTTSSITAYFIRSLIRERQELREKVNDNKTIPLTFEEIDILLDQELKMAQIDNRKNEKEDSFELEIQEGEEKN